jgi:hypothetical protein
MNTIDKIQKLSSDLAYLKSEYNSLKLWGSAPDGDVQFNHIMEWLGENEHTALMMVEAAKRIKLLEGS